MRLLSKISQWFDRWTKVETHKKTPVRPERGRVDHVVIIDGPKYWLREGCETNAGLLYKILCEMPPDRRISLRNEVGVQWRNWSSFRDVLEGRGSIARSVERMVLLRPVKAW